MEDVDFGYADSWDARMPERLRWLRENDPVHWSEKTDAYVVTRFDDVVHVSKNNDVFCSGQGVLPGRLASTSIGLIDEDEPRHGELRSLINRGFTPRMVKQWTELFKEIADETLDAIEGRGECDFVDDVAVPMPLILIAEMIGIRKEDRRRFHQWSDAMIAAQGNLDKPEVIAASAKAAMEYFDYVSEIIADRRQNPRDDLISILVRAKDEGVLGEKEGRHSELIARQLGRSEQHRAMSKDELIKMCVLLLVAGNETTRNALSGGMQLLIENPDARRRLIDQPSLIPQAVEEMLRLVSPVLSFQRTTTCDTELRGVPVPKGKKVLMIYGSANRDAAVFEDPDRFDIDRQAQHVAFGIGNHFCLGANLARMEMRVAFGEILRRFPDMAYRDEGPVFGSSALVRSVKHMHVAYSAK